MEATDSAFPKLPKQPRQKFSLGVFRQNLGRLGCFNVFKHLEIATGRNVTCRASVFNYNPALRGESCGRPES